MKLVKAIVRTTALENTVKALEDTGVHGMSISEVRGVGEEVRLFSQYSVHNMIDIIVHAEDVERVVNVLLDVAHTGLEGDGLIAVCPLDYLIHIRTKEKIIEG
jgi:nitrogen regulatory protein P-II 1